MIPIGITTGRDGRVIPIGITSGITRPIGGVMIPHAGSVGDHNEAAAAIGDALDIALRLQLAE